MGSLEALRNVQPNHQNKCQLWKVLQNLSLVETRRHFMSQLYISFGPILHSSSITMPCLCYALV